MGIKKIVKNAKKAINEIINGTSWRAWDMTTPENRENTVQEDYSFSLTKRSPNEAKWIEKDNYYHNKHATATEVYNELKARGIPWTPAVVPESYIHVESQIIPEIPDFEFNGRDDDLDSKKAKQREYVVKYVLENNKVNDMNTENERRLNILGNAFWKVAYDGSIEGYGYNGDIVVGNPGCENILPDPAAVDIDDCEFIIYMYRMHRRKVGRKFHKELKKLEMTMDSIGADGNQSDTEIFDNQVRDVNDDTVQVVEYWFRQNDYGSQKTEYDVKGEKVSKTVEWEPGDIACSIQINNIEIKYIPKYWINTGKQNKLYPFVKYCKIPVYNSFWDMSDLDAIKDLQDQEDRELAIAILNDAFTANDIILTTDNAFADDSEPANSPGAIWKMKDGKMDGVRRLGGLGNPTNRLEMINFLRQIIQEVVGNFDVSQGKEPVRVTTASGIAQLNEKADARKNIKKADRLLGFERLYELIDWTALEFYDDNRLVFIGATEEKAKQAGVQMKQYMQQTGNPIQNLDSTKGPVIFKFNSEKMRVLDGTGEEPNYYYPRVDAVVNAGDGLRKSKAFTLAAIENLVAKKIDQTNYKLVLSMIDIMDLPQKKEIDEFYEKLYSTPPPGTGLPSEGVAPDTITEMEKLAAEVEQMPPQQQIQALQGVV